MIFTFILVGIGFLLIILSFYFLDLHEDFVANFLLYSGMFIMAGAMAISIVFNLDTVQQCQQ